MCASVGIQTRSATLGSCRRYTRSRASITSLPPNSTATKRTNCRSAFFGGNRLTAVRYLLICRAGTITPILVCLSSPRTLGCSAGLTSQMDMYGSGDHGGGPTRVVLEEGRHWMQPDKVAPRMKFGTAQSFFNAIEPKLASDSPLWDYRLINDY